MKFGAKANSQYTVDPLSERKWYVIPSLSHERNATGFPLSLGNVHVFDRPSVVTCSMGSRACTLSTLPVRRWHSLHWHSSVGVGSLVVEAELSAFARGLTRGHVASSGSSTVGMK